jgi:hypothetical protein
VNGAHVGAALEAIAALIVLGVVGFLLLGR